MPVRHPLLLETRIGLDQCPRQYGTTATVCPPAHAVAVSVSREIVIRSFIAILDLQPSDRAPIDTWMILGLPPSVIPHEYPTTPCLFSYHVPTISLIAVFKSSGNGRIPYHGDNLHGIRSIVRCRPVSDSGAIRAGSVSLVTYSVGEYVVKIWPA